LLPTKGHYLDGGSLERHYLKVSKRGSHKTPQSIFKELQAKRRR